MCDRHRGQRSSNRSPRKSYKTPTKRGKRQEKSSEEEQCRPADNQRGEVSEKDMEKLLVLKRKLLAQLDDCEPRSPDLSCDQSEGATNTAWAMSASAGDATSDCRHEEEPAPSVLAGVSSATRQNPDKGRAGREVISNAPKLERDDESSNQSEVIDANSPNVQPLPEQRLSSIDKTGKDVHCLFKEGQLLSYLIF